MDTRVHRSSLYGFLFLLLFLAVLWKGGKALDATWVLAFTACGIAFADALFVREDEKASPPFLPWFLSVLFLSWTILSFASSTTKNVGLDELIQTASFFLLLQFTLRIPKSELHRFRSRFARLLAAASLIACGIGIVVYSLQPVSRFVGTFFDYRFSTDYWPNALAEFLLFVWPLMIWSLWGRRESIHAPLLKILVMGFLLSCFFLSYSRGAFIALMLQCVFLVFLALIVARKQCAWRRIFKISLSVVVASIAVFTLVNQLRAEFHPVQSVLEKATFTASEGTSSVSERRQFWGQAIQFIRQKPLFGFGPYSFRFIQPHIQTDVLATSDHPHNVFLKFAMERGVPASVLFFLIVACSFLSGFRALFHHDQDESRVLLTLLLLTSVFGVLLHNLIDFNLQFVAIGLPFWLALGLICDRSSRKKFSGFFSIASFLIAFSLLLVTVSEGRYLLLSSFARSAERQSDNEGALRWYSLTDASMFPRDAWLSRAGIFLSEGKLPEAQDMITNGLALNEQDFRLWKLQGDLFLKQKRPTDALSAFETAYRFGRYNDLGITRVLVELLSKNPAMLDVRRHEFELLMNDFGLAIENNTHFIDLSTNVEELSKLCVLFAKIYPSDASIYRDLSKRSTEHSLFERSRLTSRPRELLR